MVSNMQQQMYVAWQKDKVSTAYNMPGAFLIEGQLDIAKIKQVFKMIINRYDIYRTIYEYKNATLQQIVLSQNQSIEIEILVKSSDLDSQITSLVTPFDLHIFPLIRIKILQESSNRSVLFIDMHHINGDAHSTSIFFSEFIRLYFGEKLFPVKYQYTDYIDAIRKGQYDKSMEKQKKYWISQLANLSELIELPFKRVSSENRLGRKHYLFSNNEFSNIKKFCKEMRLTHNTLFLTTLFILLHKYSYNSDITVGSVAANRVDSMAESIVGPLINTVVLRGEVSPDSIIEDALKSTTKILINMLENQAFPYDQLINETNSSDFFNVMYDFQEDKIDKFEMGNLKFTPVEVFTSDPKVPACFHILEKNDEFTLCIEYDESKYDGKSISLIASHYINLLNYILANPRQSVANIDYMSEEEKNQIKRFSYGNTAKTPYTTIDAAFKAQVSLNANRTALVFEEQKLTYKELDQVSNQAANFLINKGLVSVETVALLMDNILLAVIFMLACCKTGNTYVPIGLGYYPDDFISHIVKSSSAKMLITDQRKEKECNYGCESILFNEMKSFDDYDKNPLAIKPCGNDRQYIIFTSGTTGKPKGVPITNENLCSVIFASNKILKNNSNTKALQFSSLSFDMSVWEIFTTLLFGGELHLLSSKSEIRKKIEPYIALNEINYMTLTPSMLNVLTPKEIPCLTKIVSAGESLNRQVAEKWVDRKLINAYGPTETTICATMGLLSPNNLSNIGEPIDNVACFVLDKYKKVVPIGIKGELYIAGKGLSKGYISASTKDDLKFSDIFIFGEKMRTYQTGDLCSWNQEVKLEIHGRSDHQINIRGYRIELDEINSVLKEVADAKEVFTIYDETAGLVSYIILEKGKAEISEKIVIGNLRKKLPRYMVSEKIFYIDKFPVTKGGKIDRKKLLEMASHTGKVGTDNIPIPRNSSEELLLKIWKKILGMQNISIDDNFFEIGGHSLNAIQVMTEAKEHNLKFEIEDLFEQNTIRRISDANGW